MKQIISYLSSSEEQIESLLIFLNLISAATAPFKILLFAQMIENIYALGKQSYDFFARRKYTQNRKYNLRFCNDDVIHFFSVDFEYIKISLNCNL